MTRHLRGGGEDALLPGHSSLHQCTHNGNNGHSVLVPSSSCYTAPDSATQLGRSLLDEYSVDMDIDLHHHSSHKDDVHSTVAARSHTDLLTSSYNGANNSLCNNGVTSVVCSSSYSSSASPTKSPPGINNHNHRHNHTLVSDMIERCSSAIAAVQGDMQANNYVVKVSVQRYLLIIRCIDTSIE